MLFCVGPFNGIGLCVAGARDGRNLNTCNEKTRHVAGRITVQG